MAISSSDLVGGGVFRTENFVHSQTIASGQTGDLVTIGTAGKVSRLTFLISSIGQDGISIEVDGSIIIGPDLLGDQTSPAFGTFWVAPGAGDTSNMVISSGSILDIFGEFITIKKDTGNTSADLRYSYETGSIK